MDSLKQKISGLTPFAKKHKVTVVGSGNWGSTIAKLVAENTAAHPELFERDVQMWVYEENVDIHKDSKHYDASSELSQGPVKLTRVINELHENIKYLPDIPLPHNLIANPDIKDSIKDSTILIFNMPHQFIEKQCGLIKGEILPFARGISCIKGVNVQESSVSLFSESIGQELGIYCGALSGANIANEVAQEKFSETTIAYDPPAMDSKAPTPATSRGPSPSASQVDLTKIQHKDVHGKTSKIKLSPLPSEYQPIDHGTIKKLFHRRYFHVRVVSDVAGVSIGGALKNVIALAAGWVDGLGWGDNAKAAIMRVGLLEMLDFGTRFFSKTVRPATFTEESAGVADLITTCNGGRHVRCAKKSIVEGKTIAEIEARDLNGQKLQGTLTAYEVNSFLKSKGAEKDFPLMTAVYDILEGKAKAEDLPDLIESDDEDVAKPLPSGRPQSIPNAPLIAHRSDVPIPSNPDTKSTADQTPPKPPSSSESILVPAPALASSRYNRQLLLPQISLTGQFQILSSRVLIIGLGGLGSPAALYLAGAGVGTLGFVDGDTVEKSNLHRQIVHREDSVPDPSEGRQDMSKVHSAIRGCKELNSDISYIAHEEHLSVSNALGIIETYDLVLDCTDNPATRYLISDACVIAEKTLISGAAQKLEGQLTVLNYPNAASSPTATTTARNITDDTAARKKTSRGPCYRCIFPHPPDPSTVQSCSEIGILGPVVGCIGTMMASETLRLLTQGAHLPDTQIGEERRPSILLYNAWPTEPKTMFRTITLAGKRRGCVACGEEEEVTRLGKVKITREGLEGGTLDYDSWCGRFEDVRVLGREQRVGAAEFLTLRGAADPGTTKGDVNGDMRTSLTVNADTTQRLNHRPKGKRRSRIIDVREPNEFLLGVKLPDAINIPISKILRDPRGCLDEIDGVNSETMQVCDEREDNGGTGTVSVGEMGLTLFVCQRGNDSQLAAQKIIELQQQEHIASGRPRGWIGDIEGGFVALERALQSEEPE